MDIKKLFGSNIGFFLKPLTGRSLREYHVCSHIRPVAFCGPECLTFDSAIEYFEPKYEHRLKMFKTEIGWLLFRVRDVTNRIVEAYVVKTKHTLPPINQLYEMDERCRRIKIIDNLDYPVYNLWIDQYE